jgi:Resolvase, N terminal domain/Tn3 transposase DDE domain
MLIGYARVSTNEQDTTAQASALKAAGCERIFREKATGGRWNRPELQRLLDHLRKGDVLVVWKLDRLSRSLRDVLTIMERIQEAKAGFRSLTEAIDTTTPAGRMMMQMIGSFAEFERAMLRERTRVGLESARGEGRIDLRIEEHYTDTAGFTDHVFALCHLLGFRFAPRIRDLADKRLYVPGKERDHPTLAPLIGAFRPLRPFAASNE